MFQIDIDIIADLESNSIKMLLRHLETDQLCVFTRTVGFRHFHGAKRIPVGFLGERIRLTYDLGQSSRHFDVRHLRHTTPSMMEMRIGGNLAIVCCKSPSGFHSEHDMIIVGIAEIDFFEPETHSDRWYGSRESQCLYHVHPSLSAQDSAESCVAHFRDRWM